MNIDLTLLPTAPGNYQWLLPVVDTADCFVPGELDQGIQGSLKCQTAHV